MSEAPRPRVPRTVPVHPAMPAPRVLAVSLVLLAACSAASAQRTPVVGPDATQQVQLVEGPNLVALSVYPEDLRIESLFEGVMDRIVLVKNADGSVYAPQYGVYDLDHWEWNEAHLVYARAPATLSVVGRTIEARTPLVLSAGWNWTPFTGTADAPVEDALRTIGESVTRVEDADGRVYPADGVSPELSALVPGQGYRVHVSRADTLVYSGDAPVPTPPGDQIAVASMAEALALQGLAPGQVVHVAGYYESGDGGGGQFDVVESGAAPDGGTVFVPDEHVSGVVSETHPFRTSQKLESLPTSQRVVFGTLTLDVLDSDGEVRLSIPDQHLHGHAYARAAPLSPTVDYSSGRISFYTHRIPVYGGGRKARYVYRHTTSDIRLVRRLSAPELYVEWFGVRPADDGPNWTGTTDSQPLIAWTLNAALRFNNETSGAVSQVRLSHASTYDYFGSLVLPEGITLRGAGGTVVRTVTNDLGHTYRPVRIRPDHTRLRVMDGEAFRQVRQRRPESDPAHHAPTPKFAVGAQPTVMWVGHGVTRAGLEDVVLDGNWENNSDLFDGGWSTHRERKSWGQDSPGNAGFVSTRHGGVHVPQGQEVVVRNVALDGFFSNGFLGDANSTWSVENVRLGNGLWNHLVYNANGSYRNLTFFGAAWGHAAWGYGEIENLVFEDGVPNPFRRASEVFGIRGGDAFDADDLAGHDGSFTREDGSAPDVTTTITGFYFDHRGSGVSTSFRGLGSNVHIRGVSADEPGRVVGGAAAIYQEGGNGYQKGLYDNNIVEHVVYYDYEDSRRQSLFGELNVTNSLFSDIRTNQDLLGTPEVMNHVLRFDARHRGRAAWDERQSVSFEDIHDTAPTYYVATSEITSDAVGRDVRVNRSSFNNTTNTIVRGPDGTGTLDQFGIIDVTKLRILWNDVDLRLHNDHFQNLDLFLTTGFFQRVTDMETAHTSEQNGRVSLRADGGESTIDIPTALLWRPLSPSYVDVVGSVPGLVESVVVVRSASDLDDWRAPILRVNLSRPLSSDEEVAFDWSAAVRPFPPGEN